MGSVQSVESELPVPGRRECRYGRSCSSCTATESVPDERSESTRPTGSRPLKEYGRTHTPWPKKFTASASPPRIRLLRVWEFPKTRRIGRRQGLTTCCWGQPRRDIVLCHWRI